MPSESFQAFFNKATGKTPYPYQISLATAPVESRLISVPTGCGKTAAVILAWLWRRREYASETPRRLVYCLPMRVLVEQTRNCALDWLDAVGMLAGDVQRVPAEDGKRERIVAESYKWRPQRTEVGVHVLMGGEEAEDWDVYPEASAVLIGTQDMLLSRALNRGYGMSRYRWPMHFGLLHTDCLWVFDEVQLMGSGFATTAQLETFRAAAGGNGCYSWWMSATLDPTWLETVDFKKQVHSLPVTRLEEKDLEAKELRETYEADKPIKKTDAVVGDCSRLAEEITKAHVEAKGRTLVVMNTVKRARELHYAVRKALKKAKNPHEPILIHSQFRPPDRQKQIECLLAEPDQHGMIVISTQVVEAGVDVSARTLFTELAPWSSLVQRFGRCNRRGEDNGDVKILWIDLPPNARKEELDRLGHPYELKDLQKSRELLGGLKEKDVGPKSLHGVKHRQAFEHTSVIRRKDFIDLFDTTPDLAGNDIDIDRYVREVEDSDVQVFWRDWDGEPSAEMLRPGRDELCRVPIREFRTFLKDKDKERRGLCCRWEYLDDCWVHIDERSTYPGQIYLLHVSAGRYSGEVGWAPELAGPVDPIPSSEAAGKEEANDNDPLSQTERWESIAEHTDEVCSELKLILDVLHLAECELKVMGISARWHDRGKAHPAFLAKLKLGAIDDARGAGFFRGDFAAKAPGNAWVRGQNKNPDYRKHFRHELASALSLLERKHPQLTFLPDDELNLVAYLVAAHHGKVRLSIRSLPEELVPNDDRRFARGVWDDDELPATDLGGGVTAPAVKLSIELMELGLCEEAPFAGQPSWAERVLRLRDTIGPLRLAYLEALLRAADRRASDLNRRTENEYA